MRALCLGLLAFAVPALAQLSSWTEPLPRRSKPPVVFITGHDSICPDPGAGEISFFNLTFGKFDEVVVADGRVALEFGLCRPPDRPDLVALTADFAQKLLQLRYQGGEPVAEVDVIAHSIGGLVLRSYLSGAIASGRHLLFEPPRIRKVVFLGTPHFGTAVATSFDTDPQLRQSSPGSLFLFQLATWNQGRENLRGADAIAIAGTAGVNTQRGVSDSVVTVPSASLDFAVPNRTFALPLCHTQGGIGQLFLCDSARGIASVPDRNHPTGALALAFLNAERDEWRAVAERLASPLPSNAGAGLVIQRRTADNQIAPIRSASLVYPGGRSVGLEISGAGLAYGDNLPVGEGRLLVDGFEQRVVLRPGASQAILIKPEPLIESVEPVTAPGGDVVLAPGMLVRIRGRAIVSDRSAFRLGAATPLQRIGTDGNGVLVVLPEVDAGTLEITVQNEIGAHSVRVPVAPAAPSLFRSGPAIAVAQPVVPGEVLTLFLTGLGATESAGEYRVHVEQPVVTVNGLPCTILFSGRAPGLPGLDQVNCVLPSALPGGFAPLVISSHGRSDSGLLPVR